LRIDEGEGVWESLAEVGKPFYPDEKPISRDRVRIFVRELQRHELVLPHAVSRFGTTVYLLPQHYHKRGPYEPRRIARGMIDLERSAQLRWDAEPSRALIAGGERLPRPQPTTYRDVPISVRLRQDYSDAIIRRAVDACIVTYGERLERADNWQKALRGACKRLKQEERDAEQQRHAADLQRLRRREQSVRASEAAQQEDPVSAEIERRIAEAVARGVPLATAAAQAAFSELATCEEVPAAVAQPVPPAGGAVAPLRENGATASDGTKDVWRDPHDQGRARLPSAGPPQGADVVPPPVAPPGGGSAASPPLTLAEAVRALLQVKRLTTSEPTQKFYEDRLRIVERIAGSVPVADWNCDAVLRYVAERQKENPKLKPVTIGKELENLIKPALYFAIQRGVKIPDPRSYWPPLKYKKGKRKRYLHRKNFVPLFEQLKPSLHRSWLLWGVYTGGCKGELEALTWGDIDLEAELVHIRGTKAEKRDRVLKLHRRLVKWCHKSAARIRKETGRGPPPESHVLKPWTNSVRDLAAACERANIPRVTLHDLRRTFSSWLRQAGVPDAHNAELMGHADTRQVCQVYGQLSAEQLEAAISKL
jgi:integrase